MNDFDIWLFLFTTVISTEGLFVVLLILATDLYRRKHKQESFWLVGTSVLTVVSIVSLKTFYAVPRPADAMVVLESYAFPSGHATGVLFLAVVLWWHLVTIHKFPRVWSAVGLLAFAGVVGYSRLVLGVHTELQVLAGYCLGLLTGLFFLYLVRTK